MKYVFLHPVLMLWACFVTPSNMTMGADTPEEKAKGKTYYVDDNNSRASDENAGNEQAPWKTLNHAATLLRAGDTVLVKEGTYNVGASPNWAVPAVSPKNSGTAEAPITFRAFPGHRVTITTSGG